MSHQVYLDKSVLEICEDTIQFYMQKYMKDFLKTFWNIFGQSLQKGMDFSAK